MTDCPIDWDDETDRMLAGDDEPCSVCACRGCEADRKAAPEEETA